MFAVHTMTISAIVIVSLIIFFAMPPPEQFTAHYIAMALIQPLGDMFLYGPGLHFLASGRRLLCIMLRVVRPIFFYTIEVTLYGMFEWRHNVPTIIALIFSNLICSLWILFIASGKTLLNVTNLEELPLPGLFAIFKPFLPIIKNGV